MVGQLAQCLSAPAALLTESPRERWLAKPVGPKRWGSIGESATQSRPREYSAEPDASHVYGAHNVFRKNVAQVVIACQNFRMHGSSCSVMMYFQS
jgi:hypothetical protein